MKAYIGVFAVTSGQEWTHLPPEIGPTKPEIAWTPASFIFGPT